MRDLNFTGEPAFSLHYDFYRFVVYLNILFYLQEFLESDIYKIGEYLIENHIDLYIDLQNNLIETQSIYYDNIETVNNFVDKYQKKYLDVEDIVLDYETNIIRTIQTQYKKDIVLDNSLKSIYYNSHCFYNLILQLEKVELKKLIVYLNTTLDDKIFDEFVDILIVYYKELYPKQEKVDLESV